MRDIGRLDGFYAELKRIHAEHFPDWRFGQLIINFVSWMYRDKETDIFFPEEDRMLEYFKEFANEEEN